jgi:acyl-CoA hydrolase/RimJ/RimL family protein N-acetyltransferase
MPNLRPARRRAEPKALVPADWPRLVRPGARVFVGSHAAVPTALIDSLLADSARLTDVEFVHHLTLGPAPWAELDAHGNVRANSFFLGPGLREAVAAGQADYTPSFIFEVPALFRDQVIPLDVALVQATPPDRDGVCSLGVSCDIVRAAVDAAPCVVAQINPRLPRTYGQTDLAWNRLAAILQATAELPTPPPEPADEVASRIANYTALLVDDESTLRIGSTVCAEAIARALIGRKHLGLHTDRLGDGLLDLIESGAVTNRRKGLHEGLTVASYAVGSRRLYDWLDRNRKVHLLPSDYVNHPGIIARHRRMVAIAGAQQVDLTGQVANDSVGPRFAAGFGGQTDFLRGAAMSADGRPIVALPSTAPDGTSRIVPDLAAGSGVVASRGDVHYVVTEWGIATLRGRSIRERVLELIQVAHPRHREELRETARARRWIPAYEVAAPTEVAGLAGIAAERIVLRDEPYWLRPLHPSDERRLQEFFYSHTQETIQARYGYMVSRMTRERAYELVNVDQTRDLALAILEVQGPRAVIHAVGRYYLDDDGRTAEIAFVTRETKRRYGMARTLLERMCTIARQRGLVALRAQVVAANRPMLALFKRQGAQLRSIPGAGAVEVRIPL